MPWNVPEDQVRMLPADLAGLDAIELGCGTAYVSAWLARRGARPVGIDNSEAHLATAKRLQREHGLEFPLVNGNAEELPFPDQSFDLAISEYGASIWCDPYKWIPEAERLLRVDLPSQCRTAEWAQRWTCEEVWKARKAG
jgi:ubiquinone/menaquinone biosynthesis C-methylase UbiE